MPESSTAQHSYCPRNPRAFLGQALCPLAADLSFPLNSLPRCLLLEGSGGVTSTHLGNGEAALLSKLDDNGRESRGAAADV